MWRWSPDEKPNLQQSSSSWRWCRLWWRCRGNTRMQYTCLPWFVYKFPYVFDGAFVTHSELKCMVEQLFGLCGQFSHKKVDNLPTECGKFSFGNGALNLLTWASVISTSLQPLNHPEPCCYWVSATKHYPNIKWLLIVPPSDPLTLKTKLRTIITLCWKIVLIS